MTEPLLPNSVLPPPQRQVASSSHVHTLPPVPMSNYEVAEPTWENGHPVMHELSGLLPPAHQKPTWVRAHETLESIVQQATGRQRQKSNFMMMMPQDHTPTSISSTVAPSNGRTAMPPERSGQEQSEPSPPARKRVRSDSGDIGNYCLEECAPSSGGCASISATFCRSFKRSKTLEDDSPSLCESENQDQEEDRDTNKEETGRSNSTRRNRAAAVHNQSEQRRRDRINQKLKALQRLVPKASKNDKASILDEVIEYLKQLQAQIQMMSMRNMPQQQMMMMMQQQLNMSMMARMGLGLGSGSGQGPGLAGLLNANTTMAALPPVLASFPQLTVAAAPAITPSFMMSPLVQAHAPPPPKPEPASATTSNASISLPDPYATFLSQSVNMDILGNMAALYRQQMRQNNRNMSSLSQQQHHGQGN